jgi:chromosome segregation ATPase
MTKKEERQKIKAQAKSTVASVLAEEEATQKVKLEEVITDYENTLAELRASEVAAAEKTDELTGKIAELESEKASLVTEIETLKAEIETLKVELEKANAKSADLEKKLSDAAKEAAMQKRTSELEEAGLLSSGPAAEKQKARVVNMNDEEFAEYKAELLAIQAEWAKKTSTTATGDPVKTDETSNVDPDPAVTPEDPKMTASQLLALKEAAKKAQKDLAFLNTPTSVDPEEEAKLMSEYASMWELEEESK